MSFLDLKPISFLIDLILGDNHSHTKSGKILSIELVPYPMHGKNVRAVVSYEQWKDICSFTHPRHKYKCVECGRSRHQGVLECHESWIYGATRQEVSPGKFMSVAVMKLMDLLTLCHKCHMGKHLGLARQMGEYAEVRKHLMKVYGLNSLQFAWKYRKSVNRVRMLSKFEFELDLTYMNRPLFSKIIRRRGRNFSSNEAQNCIQLSGNE